MAEGHVHLNALGDSSGCRRNIGADIVSSCIKNRNGGRRDGGPERNTAVSGRCVGGRVKHKRHGVRNRPWSQDNHFIADNIHQSTLAFAKNPFSLPVFENTTRAALTRNPFSSAVCRNPLHLAGRENPHGVPQKTALAINGRAVGLPLNNNSNDMATPDYCPVIAACIPSKILSTASLKSTESGNFCLLI